MNHGQSLTNDSPLRRLALPRSISIRAFALAAGDRSLPPLGTTTQRLQRERFLAGAIDGLLGAFGAALVLSAAGRIAGIGAVGPPWRKPG